MLYLCGGDDNHYTSCAHDRSNQPTLKRFCRSTSTPATQPERLPTSLSPSWKDTLLGKHPGRDLGSSDKRQWEDATEPHLNADTASSGALRPVAECIHLHLRRPRAARCPVVGSPLRASALFSRQQLIQFSPRSLLSLGHHNFTLF